MHPNNNATLTGVRQLSLVHETLICLIKSVVIRLASFFLSFICNTKCIKKEDSDQSDIIYTYIGLTGVQQQKMTILKRQAMD